MFDNVESDSFWERAALADSHQIARLNVTEAGRKVHGHVLKTNYFVNKIRLKFSDFSKKKVYEMFQIYSEIFKLGN